MSSSASALDLNSSESLQYYGNGNLGLEATTGGDVRFPGIANFTSSGIDFAQPLSVESSGPFSVGSGIDLTDSSSNTIESYSTFYLTTSSGSASDIVLDPTGEVGVGSNLNIGGNAITDTSGALTLDSSVETTGNLNMNGNSITSFFGSACPSGEVVADVNNNGNFGCVNIDTEIQDTYVNRGGDTMTGNLDMNGNTLTDTGGTFTIGGGDAEVASGGLTLADQLDINGKTGGKAITIADGSIAFEADDPTPEIETQGTGTGEIVIHDANAGNDIARFQEGGNVQIPNGNLDMGTNIIQNPQSISWPEGGIYFANADQQIFRDNDGDDVLYLKDTNNVQIPSGNLDLNGNSITSFFGSQCNSGNVVAHVNDDGTFDCVDATSEVQNDFVNRGGDTMTGSLNMQGNVLKMEGGHLNLDNGDQYITTHDGNGNFNIKSGVDQNNNIVAGTGGTHVRLDESGGFDVSVDESTGTGNTMGETVGFEVNGGEIEAGGTFNMNGNSITNFFGSACPSGEVVADVNNNGNFGCVNIDSEIQDTYVNRGGDTMTGNLDMQSNDLQGIHSIHSTNGVQQPTIDLHSSSSNDNWDSQGAHIAIGEGSTNSDTKLHLTYRGDGQSYVGSGEINNGVPLNGYIRFDWDNNITRIKGKPVRLIGGNLDVNGQSIVGHYGSACNSGNVMVDINNNGNLDCVDATNEVQGDFVSRSGDTMNGNLDMQSNTITQVGSGNIDIGDGSGDINLNGNRIYGGSLAQFESGGIGTSVSNVQNNLQGLGANSFYVADDVKVGGDFVGTGGDVAEMINTEDGKELEEGTVTVISGKKEVDASTEARDTAVAGIVSTDPGVKLAEERDGVPLALSGIVPVKATDVNGDIEPGDLLTTSDRKGYAMKCQDSLECHGAIIGKAMGSLDEKGKVEALVTLG